MAGKFKLDIRKTSHDATSRGCLRISGTIASICSALVSLQQPHIEYLDHISFGDYQVGRKATSTCSFSGSAGPVAAGSNQLRARYLERNGIRVSLPCTVCEVSCRAIVHARRAMHHLKGSIAHLLRRQKCHKLQCTAHQLLTSKPSFIKRITTYVSMYT